VVKLHPCNRPWRPMGLWDVEAPIFSRHSARRWRWGCQSYAPAALYPRKIPGNNFWYRLSWPRGHSAAGRIRSIEKSNELIGNRTRDLPACSIVPQPTTLPRETGIYFKVLNSKEKSLSCSFFFFFFLETCLLYTKHFTELLPDRCFVPSTILHYGKLSPGTKWR
jgi:hypothetical protein